MQVLLVENDINLLNSIALVLEKEGMYIDKAFDAILASSYLLNRHYDLVILDMNLNRMAAKDLMNLSFTHHVDVPFIVLTKKKHLTQSLLNFSVVANEYLSLPFKSSHLLKLIERTINLHKRKDEAITYQDFKLENFSMMSKSGKKYLTTTEFLILEKLIKGEDNLNELVQSVDDLWIYADSINAKLKALGSVVLINYKDKKYILEGGVK